MTIKQELQEIREAVNWLGQRLDAIKEREEAKLAEEAKPTKKIDWSNMPVDTLAVVGDVGAPLHIRHYSHFVDGEAYFFNDGATSKSKIEVCAWDQFLLIENPPRPWFGDPCSVPEGVKVKIWMRDGATEINDAGNYDWRHGGALTDSDIIAYQILGPMEGWE